ncbi:MAG TPA: multidrug efflux SMR transporter [Ferrovibrio sp.]|jgi:quaternary ammonium compound-resistance protein SugE|uniref:DMT family transporter n=1 Tax=Ferrovibrio sp. TaxID=1917215 RepID=UPI002ED52AAB
MSNGLAWLLLVLSGATDVLWAIATKQSEGYARPGWALLSLLSLAGFVALLSQALKVLPLGTAYAVWTGIGAVGSVLAGLLLFGETVSLAKAIALLAVIGGVIGLKLLPA